jgi:hypothetical protein
VGVLAFYSLLEPVGISKTDLQMISNLASHFGAAIAKINVPGTATGRTGT